MPMLPWRTSGEAAPLLDAAREEAQRFLDSLPERPVRAAASLEELRAAIAVALPGGPSDPLAVFREFARAMDGGIVASPGPRYFGFVIGGTLPSAIAADWMVSAWDQNPGLYATSPATSVAEETAARWVLELLGLPPESGVGFVTGCQMANFTALAAARHAMLARAGWNVEERGLHGAPPLTIVMSEEAHATIHTALRYLGFGLAGAKRVRADAQGRLDPSDLRRVLKDVAGEVVVCAQAGNVNSGAVDDLASIIDAAGEKNAWVHVDGAFGLWAAAAGSKRELVRGIDRADSWATDAHKWLNVPYDCGLVIVRDANAQRGAMGVHASYLQQTAGAERDELEWVPEFSRRGRSVPVYLALRTLGRSGVAEIVERCCGHASRFADLLSREEGVVVLNEVVLNQVLVRFADSDDVTRDVIARVQQEGTCWLGGTVWQGRAAMRISVSNWSTSEEDVERSADAVLRCFREARVGVSG